MELTSFILGFILLIIASIFGANYLSGVSCRAAYANYQPEYGFFTGCRVMWNGKLTPTDIVREIN